VSARPPRQVAIIESMPLRLIPPIHRATHRIALFVAQMEGLTLNQAEAHVLTHLAASGDATVGDVHRAFGHKRSTLTSILDRLEERRFVRRTSDARDRRTFVVALTKEGRAAARRVADHLERLEASILRDVPARDVQAFLRVLARFEAAAD
jgi:DNA-binding MarR family transcriptional regulator